MLALRLSMWNCHRHSMVAQVLGLISVAGHQAICSSCLWWGTLWQWQKLTLTRWIPLVCMTMKFLFLHSNVGQWMPGAWPNWTCSLISWSVVFWKNMAFQIWSGWVTYHWSKQTLTSTLCKGFWWWLSRRQLLHHNSPWVQSLHWYSRDDLSQPAQFFTHLPCLSNAIHSSRYSSWWPSHVFKGAS